MSEHRQLVEQFYEEVVNAGNVDKIDELLADDFVEHEELAGISQDREGVKEFFRMLRSAFPDVRFQAEDVISEGELAAEFMGVPPTGKQVTVSGIDIVRLRDGKCLEHWGQFDAMGLMQQLGALPVPAQAQG
jgi:predicted ester cyclase